MLRPDLKTGEQDQYDEHPDDVAQRPQHGEPLRPVPIMRGRADQHEPSHRTQRSSVRSVMPISRHAMRLRQPLPVASLIGAQAP